MSKEPSNIKKYVLWMIRFWWIPSAISILCLCFYFAGVQYSISTKQDFCTDWYPITRFACIIWLVSRLWRLVDFVAAICYKNTKVVLALIIVSACCMFLFATSMVRNPFGEW